MPKYFLASIWRLIQKLQDVGSLIMVVSILLLASVVLSLAVALTYLSLMILTPSKTRSRLQFWSLIMSGTLLALVSVFSLAARSCS